MKVVGAVGIRDLAAAAGVADICSVGVAVAGVAVAAVAVGRV